MIHATDTKTRDLIKVMEEEIANIELRLRAQVVGRKLVSAIESAKKGPAEKDTKSLAELHSLFDGLGEESEEANDSE